MAGGSKGSGGGPQSAGRNKRVSASQNAPRSAPRDGARTQPPSSPRGQQPSPTTQPSAARRKDRPDGRVKVAANEATRQAANAAIVGVTGGTAAPVVKLATNLIGNDKKAKRNRRRVYIAGAVLILAPMLVMSMVWTVVLFTLMGGAAGAAGTAARDNGQCLDISAPRITQPGGTNGAAPGSAGAGTLGAPLDAEFMKITSGFGGRETPTAGATSYHDGVDFSAPGIYGKPIYAPADGVVSQAGPASGYGNWVIIDHTIGGQKVSTLYGHIEDGHVHVHVGQHVTAGQRIADVGNAGASTGAHLHFGVYPGGWKSQGGVDPMPWLSKFKAQASTSGGGGPPAAENAASTGAPAEPPAPSAPGVVTPADWESLAKLESGGNWATNTGNGFSGGVQFTQSTWTANGGGKFAPQAWQASKEQQMEVANNVLKTQGWGAWPPSARVPGLRDKKPAPEGAFTGGGNPSPQQPAAAQSTAAADLPASPKGDEANLQANAQRGMRLTAQLFPQVQKIGGFRSGPDAQDHGTGSAVDVMIPDYASPTGIALGDKIAKFYIDHAGDLKIKYIIWRNKIWQNGSWSEYGNTGNDTSKHNDHVHLSFNQSGPPMAKVAGLPGISANTAAAPTGDSPDGVQPYTPDGEQKTQTLTPEQQANIKAIISAARRSDVQPQGRAAVLAIAYAGAQTNFISKQPTDQDPRIGIFGEVPLDGAAGADTTNLVNVQYAASSFFDRLKTVAAQDRQWATKKLADVLVEMYPEQATRGGEFGSWEQLAIGATQQLWKDQYSQAGASLQSVANISCAQGTVGGRTLKPGTVPQRFVKWITLAGQICDGITAPLLAAQIRAESGFNENATSVTGAEGSSQFQPTTWPTWGAKVDENGKAISPPGTGDPRNAADATMAQGHMMCSDYNNMKKLIASGRVKGDPVALTIAAYNAGIGAVLNAGGMPSGGDYTTQTQPYVARILQWAKEYDGGGQQLATDPGNGGSGGGYQQAVSVAMAQRGKPYVWGATGPDSFDCSGLTQFAYKAIGINLPRTTYAQIKLGREVSVQEAQPGDLVFSSFSSPGKPEHVQMYLGDGKVVEAQQEGVPVLVSPLPKGNYTIKHVTKEDTSSAPD